MLLKCCNQYVIKFGKLSNGHRTGKSQFSFQSQRRAMPKYIQTTVQLCSSHMLARLCLKSFKLGFNDNLNRELPDAQDGFRKGRETRDQIANIRWIIEKPETSRNTPASLTTLKPLTMQITINGGKFLKRWEYKTTLPAPCETYMQVRKQQLELDMEQQTGSK